MPKPPTGVPSEEAIQNLVNLLSGMEEGFRIMGQLAQSSRAVMNQYLRTTRAIRANKHPLDWEEFLTAFESHDFTLADLLRRVGCDRFDLGKLSMNAASSMDYSMLLIMKDRIAGFLESKYGVKFSVRAKEEI